MADVLVQNERINGWIPSSATNFAQKTWHKLLDERQYATESSQIGSTKEIVEDDTAETANSKVQMSIRGLNDKHGKIRE